MQNKAIQHQYKVLTFTAALHVLGLRLSVLKLKPFRLLPRSTLLHILEWSHLSAVLAERAQYYTSLPSTESKPNERDKVFHDCTITTKSETSEGLYFIKTPYLYKTRDLTIISSINTYRWTEKLLGKY